MKCGKLLLEMLKKYEVEYVFGLPGETTLHWYDEWKGFKGIEHVMVRDERNAVFMADGYAKVSGKPGLCEGPSVGAPHMLPGIVEAYSSCIPVIAITSDIPLNGEKHNMLTGADQTSMFKSFVKETLTVHKGTDIPFIVRRAFRLATSGRPGPVHIRLPQDVLSEDVDVTDLFAQPDFAYIPGKRSAAAEEDTRKAIQILKKAKRGVMVCGQGALSSCAWDEVKSVAEKFELAVVTTINGKGVIAETHPLSGGVIGARGANSFSNSLISEGDVIFFVGSSTDSAGTAGWKIPAKNTHASIIQLDINEAELGNNYPTKALLLGDAKETLAKLLEYSRSYEKGKGEHTNLIAAKRSNYEKTLVSEMESNEFPCNPLHVMAKLQDAMPENSILVVDPGIAAVYPAGFIKMKKAGRHFVCNFAQGSLGYATSAAMGAAKASPNSTIVHITGDGSFGFCAGEYETLARTACNVKVILVNNHSFGWIRVSNSMAFNNEPFATQFADIDYVKIMEGFGLPADRVTKTEDLPLALEKLFKEDGPSFLEIPFEPEDKCVPPVPGWAEKARNKGMKNLY
jgi:acetolactate synthase-1/2/3 large subunit